MKLSSIIETILFVHGAPMSTEALARVTKKSLAEVGEALKELKKDLAGRGIVLLEKDGEWQLGSSPENASAIEELVKNEFAQELSRSALETLAIVAYRGPIARVDIEYLRGVNSSFILRTLLMRGLVERTENPHDARSFLYRVSFDFLKHFGLTSPEELPHWRQAQAQAATLLTAEVDPPDHE
jgi:segregation and condensation protein B